jgi:hypothetical protein
MNEENGGGSLKALPFIETQAGYSVFAGVAECSREGNDLFHEMCDSKIEGCSRFWSNACWGDWTFHRIKFSG